MNEQMTHLGVLIFSLKAEDKKPQTDQVMKM